MYDVIVAGAGPAGSTCARTCAQRGLKTLLLDRDAFPRSKPCAGAVSEQALSYLDFPLPERVIEEECYGVRVHQNGRHVEVKRDRRFAVLVSRKNFDSLLAAKAVESGARFLTTEQVIDVRESTEQVEVVTRTASYPARYLVGADGIHSRVALALRPPLSKDEMALALVTQAPAAEQEIKNRLGKTLDLYFGAAPMGYGWLFPHRGYYSAGIAGLVSRFSKPREALTDLARALNVALTDLQGHFIPFGGIRRTVAKGRTVLAGDAAGFADPFHGEGISHAILSGKLAAHAIIGVEKNKKAPSSLASRYQRETEQRIRKNLRVALRMANLLDKYPGLFRRIFFDHPEALQRFLDIPAGRMDYRHFQRWILVRLPFLLSPPAAAVRPR